MNGEVEPEEKLRKGLEGVIAAETKIGYANGSDGKLFYRGYEINSLVEQSNYEEVSYLLLYGHLPKRKEYEKYVTRLREQMVVPDEVYSLIESIGAKAHPMSTLRTAVSYLSCFDKEESEATIENQERIGVGLIARMPAIVGAIHRIYSGKPITSPNPDLGYAANLFYMSTGTKPDPVESKIMDTSLILHADHGMNASTFSALVTISTMADMYSAVTSAVATLKGSLHGGANERALKMIQSIGHPGNAEKELKAMTERGDKVVGFGHRVYKVYDPRAKILKRYAEYFAESRGNETLKTAEKIEELMINKYGERGIFPNVDFYSGMIYDSMGFKAEIFTPLFVAGRISGWVARALEYSRDNRIFRPNALYTGEKGPRKYIPIQDRD